jgi:hypothetical protein
MWGRPPKAQRRLRRRFCYRIYLRKGQSDSLSDITFMCRWCYHGSHDQGELSIALVRENKEVENRILIE